MPVGSRIREVSSLSGTAHRSISFDSPGYRPTALSRSHIDYATPARMWKGDAGPGQDSGYTAEEVVSLGPSEHEPQQIAKPPQQRADDDKRGFAHADR